ncbi:MAG: response regulator [Bradyrhizobium sp.]|uniref:response regulator n=1 Tax=Bradyrhizobium sp. TaxID=376 RepID=UPI001C290D2A|nr:response regulator [Bradyrhizobium sp.]MBU6462926.1 response regulator [Pseudomonadota bacterium]MDE2068129.1 response regulator [Bradyrhizobium sp.]MDE2471139.1 response regulator [Bradyrhizobium sp.]
MENPRLLILVVEDDYYVKEMVQEALSDGGFESEIVASGEEAVTLLKDKHDKYRAVVTDINLQGQLTGWDVATGARELNPDMPVVYMTGAAAEDWSAHGVPNSVLLQKPFAPAQVVTAVSQLLNQVPPAPHE